MAAEIVNLRRFRKRRARDAARQEADARAAQHGESPAARAARKQEARRQTRQLDAAARDRPGEPDAD